MNLATKHANETQPFLVFVHTASDTFKTLPDDNCILDSNIANQVSYVPFINRVRISPTRPIPAGTVDVVWRDFVMARLEVPAYVDGKAPIHEIPLGLTIGDNENLYLTFKEASCN